MAFATNLSKLGMLNETNTAFFQCDIQENFKPAMLYFPEVIQNAKKLVQASVILDIPLIVTEQYPKGLGKTVSEIDVRNAFGVFEKTKFSMLVPQVEQAMAVLCRGQLESVVLFGIEAHVCVEQTAIELVGRGLQVHIVADASTSRSQEDRLFAFERMKQIGCFLTTSESVIFKLLGDKDHPMFGKIRSLIKQPLQYTGLVTKL